MSNKVSLAGVNEIIADVISLQEGSSIVNCSDEFLDKSEAYNKPQKTNTSLSGVYANAGQLIDVKKKTIQAQLILKADITSVISATTTVNGNIALKKILLIVIIKQKLIIY